ncbi:potassium channel family protein [Pontibacter qinzhouensis]|uniref:potassium channel family protein n=1 Tax=Pontibacter qinzhouensis TaxID=2603253 RepID=UPI001C9CD500|nr:potassium channel family protein [Pontibacter qinzhouensis]
MIATLLIWILGLWMGLLLVLLSNPDSIVSSSTLARASVSEKLYYAGFSLSTLGVGDYKATTDTWRIITSIAAFSGLAFITASVTYFLPVLSAVGLQSKLSLYINSMGRTPQLMLINSWNGKGFSSFFDNTSDLCQMLLQHSMNHHSYPVIHYFHNNTLKQSIAPAIVLLHETCLLLKQAVSDKTELDVLKMNMLQTTLDSYLEVIRGEFVTNASPQIKAPTPDLQQLYEAGIPLKNQEEITRGTLNKSIQERRKLLSALLEADGWSWHEVYQAQDRT